MRKPALLLLTSILMIACGTNPRPKESVLRSNKWKVLSTNFSENEVTTEFQAVAAEEDIVLVAENGRIKFFKGNNQCILQAKVSPKTITATSGQKIKCSSGEKDNLLNFFYEPIMYQIENDTLTLSQESKKAMKLIPYKK